MRNLLYAGVALLALSGAAEARVLVQNAVVAHVTQSWDSDTSAGAGGCAMFQLTDGRQFAIFPLYTPGGTMMYQTVLAAKTSGITIGFWDEGETAVGTCHFDSNNQPLHYIYSPGL